MRALLIVAHGSRRAESNLEIKALTEQVTSKAGEHFDLVDCAFLELADPLIPEGVISLVGRGAKSIVVVPYFLAKGAHVIEDIPQAVAQAQLAHPEIKITVSNYFGASEIVPNALTQLAVTAAQS